MNHLILRPFFNESIQVGQSLAIYLNRADFLKPQKLNGKATTLINDLLKHNQFMYIASHAHNNQCGHTTALFRYHSHYIYYDPNEDKGLEFFNAKNLDKMIDKLFADHDYQTNGLFGFRNFSVDKILENQINTEYYLETLQTPKFLFYESDIKLLNSQIIMATQINAITSVEYCLKNGANVNQTFRDGSSLLNQAAYFDRIDVAKLLIAYDANLNFLNKKNFSSIELAVINGQERIVKLLLEKEVSVINPVNYISLTAFVLQQRKINVLRILLEHGLNPNELIFGQMHLLHMAASFDDEHTLASIKLLYEYGARLPAAESNFFCNENLQTHQRLLKILKALYQSETKFFCRLGLFKEKSVVSLSHAEQLATVSLRV